ncbi:MAG TPA: hypothetical protein VIL55_06460 [Naasia sp.]
MSLKHDELPLPDYDHLPVGNLASHLQPLDATAVAQLLEYEREHGNRLPVTQVLEHRLDALRNGAEPSGTLSGAMPEVTQSQHGSPVTAATTGPKINPPSHGDPTNPAQPR